MNIKNICIPNNLDEAYSALIENKRNTVLGGCMFLRMGDKNINTAIDLSNLNLDQIIEKDDTIEIGTYTTFRQIETSDILNKYYGNLLKDSVEHIIGVQFRNNVTVGGTVYSKYGFSDFITALLSLNVYVKLYSKGLVKLEEFLENTPDKDILEKIIIKKEHINAKYISIRNSYSDYPIINVAVSNKDSKFRIVIGSRPSCAKLAIKASKYLSENDLTNENIEKAALIATEELKFGTNMRGSAKYRKEVSKALICKSIKEVL